MKFFSKKKPVFQLTRKQLIWMPVLNAYDREWPLLVCQRQSASAFETEEDYQQSVLAVLEQQAEAIKEVKKQNYPKASLFGKFPKTIGKIAWSHQKPEIEEVKTVKVLVSPSDKTPLGIAFYNAHPVSDKVLEQDAPLRQKYPTLSRLMSAYYDEDFFNDDSEDSSNPLSVMAEFCFEEKAETVQSLLNDITHYLKTNPTSKEAESFLTALGNEFAYQGSQISALEWLEYLRVRLEDWVFHGDEPISLENNK
ncbi:hypothetical protein FAI41_02120 [Acetobacteraceae bacterium]|nr:hypothetical protein FAI41_02120 [Acetobacteraceae bacterium]